MKDTETSNTRYNVIKQPPILIRHISTSVDPPVRIDLSCIDNMAGMNTFCFAFLYSKPLPTNRLQQTLQSVLATYPILCGSAIVSKGRWHVMLDNSGVEWVTAYSDSRLMQTDSTAIAFDALPERDEITVCSNHPPWMDGQTQRSVIFQTTQFACGCTILGMSVLHCIVDVDATFAFMYAWANATHPVTSFASPVPLHNRSLISTLALPAEPLSGCESILSTLSDAICLPDISRSVQCYRFSSATIARMKQAVRRTIANSAKHISTNDVLCTHLWKCITRVQNDSLAQETTFCMAVNWRSRLPTLWTHYFGNLIAPCACTLPRAELLQQPPEKIIAAMRSALDKVDAVFIGKIIAFLEQKPHHSLSWKSSLMISNISKFSLYKSDFGQGSPRYVWLPKSSSDGGSGNYCCLFPDNDGVQAQVFLVDGLLSALEDDPEWRHYQAAPLSIELNR